MGVSAGPRIVTDGLRTTIDSANTKSYAGSGTNVTDRITSNSTDLTIKDSLFKVYDLEVADYVFPNNPSTSLSLPTFSSSNLGSITFDGTSNYLDFSSSNLSSTATVEIWVKLGANYTDNVLFSFGNYTVRCISGGLGFNTSNNDLYGISSANVSSLGLIGQWKQYVFEMRSDVSYTNNKIYVNSVSQPLSQQTGTESSFYRNFNSGIGRISAWSSSTGYEMPMEFSFFRIYNKVLSSSEILSNFNSSRGRFGI